MMIFCVYLFINLCTHFSMIFLHYTHTSVYNMRTQILYARAPSYIFCFSNFPFGHTVFSETCIYHKPRSSFFFVLFLSCLGAIVFFFVFVQFRRFFRAYGFSFLFRVYIFE